MAVNTSKLMRTAQGSEVAPVEIATITLVDGFTIARDSKGVFHEPAFRPVALPTPREAGPGNGDLSFMFAGPNARTRAQAAYNSVCTGGAHYVTDSDESWIGGTTWMLDGTAELELDDATRQVWHVRVPFRAVSR